MKDKILGYSFLALVVCGVLAILRLGELQQAERDAKAKAEMSAKFARSYQVKVSWKPSSIPALYVAPSPTVSPPTTTWTPSVAETPPVAVTPTAAPRRSFSMQGLRAASGRSDLGADDDAIGDLQRSMEHQAEMDRAAYNFQMQKLRAQQSFNEFRR